MSPGKGGERTGGQMPRSPEKNKGLTKRSFLRHLVGNAAMVSLALGAGAYVARIVEKEKAELRTREALERETFDLTKYDMQGFFVGSGNSLSALYTQHEGRLPSKIAISYPKALSTLIEKKKEFAKNKGKKFKFKRDLVSEYRESDRELCTFQEAVATMDSIAKEYVTSHAWAAIQKEERYKKLSEEAKDRLLGLISKIDGKTLMAFSMKEITDSEDGEQNKKMYNFLLRTAGKSFIARIPAIHDPVPSLGPLQMSSLADKEVESLVTFEDHVRSAMKYCARNLFDAVQKVQDWPALTPSGEALFEGLDGAKLAAFVAAYHHRPRTARALLYAWVTDAKGEHSDFSDYADRVPPPLSAKDKKNDSKLAEYTYEVRATKRVARYMKITMSNHKAI